MSTKKYVVSLRNDRQGQFSVFDLIPRPTYSSDDGFGLKGGLKYPVGDDGELFFRYQWMTKEGFKPSYGYRHYLPWGVATVGVSRESATLNARTVWVEKNRNSPYIPMCTILAIRRLLFVAVLRPVIGKKITSRAVTTCTLVK